MAVHYAISDVLVAAANAQTSGQAACPAGQSVLGGGALVDSTDIQVSINRSYPYDADGMIGGFLPDGGWAAAVNNTSGVGSSFVVYAICTKAGSASSP